MSWYRLVNLTQNKARIDIYDSIGEFTDWWTGEKTGLAARDFSATLTALDQVGEIELHINSPGGSVPDGIQIYNELRRHQAKVTVVIDGQAASIASIVAMAGDEVVMPANTSLWIHDPMAWLDIWGYQNAGELRDAAGKALNLADDLDTTRDLLANTYLARAKDSLSRDELIAMMARETTITAEQAVAWGLADRIEEPLKQAASFDLAQRRDAVRAAVQARVNQTGEDPEPDPAHAESGDAFLALPLPLTEDAVNSALAERGVTDYRVTRTPSPMDARALIALCRDRQLASLAPDLIDAGATEAQVSERLQLAATLRDRLFAGGLTAHFDQVLTALLKDPVDAVCLAFGYRQEEGEGQIRSDHAARTGSGGALVPLKDVMAARRKRFGR